MKWNETKNELTQTQRIKSNRRKQSHKRREEKKRRREEKRKISEKKCNSLTMKGRLKDTRKVIAEPYFACHNYCSPLDDHLVVALLCFAWLCSLWSHYAVTQPILCRLTAVDIALAFVCESECECVYVCVSERLTSPYPMFRSIKQKGHQ